MKERRRRIPSTQVLNPGLGISFGEIERHVVGQEYPVNVMREGLVIGSKVYMRYCGYRGARLLRMEFWGIEGLAVSEKLGDGLMKIFKRYGFRDTSRAIQFSMRAYAGGYGNNGTLRFNVGSELGIQLATEFGIELPI